MVELFAKDYAANEHIFVQRRKIQDNSSSNQCWHCKKNSNSILFLKCLKCGFSFHIECAEKNKDNCDPQYKDPVFTIKDRETHIFLTKFVLMKICNVCNKNLSGKANYCKKCKKYSHKSHDRSTTAPLAACPVTKQSMQSSIGNDERKRISNYKIETDGINNLEENLQRGHQTVRFTTKFVKPKDVLRQDTVMYTVKKRKDAADKTKNNQSTGEVTTKTRLWQIMTDSIKILENRSPNAKQIETWHFEDMTGIKWMPNEELYMVLSFKKFQVFVPRAQATSENAMKALSKTIRECLRPFRQLLDSRRTIDIFNSCPFHERFKIYANQVLGSGQFGIVYLALDQVTKRKVAVKCVKTKKAQDDLKQEFELIKNLKHPNILEMLTLGHDSKQIMIAMDKCAMDFLEFILNENEGLLAKDVAKFYAYQAMNGLGYLHDNNIIHRDIKPENLLINKTVTAAEPFGVVKIADFGLSRMLSQEKYRRTFCGSPNYQSPEIYRCQDYSNRADIWACGVVIFASHEGIFPFSKNSKLHYSELFAREDCRDMLPELKSLLKNIFVPESHRYSAKQVLKTDYFMIDKAVLANNLTKVVKEFQLSPDCFPILQSKSSPHPGA